MKSSDVAWLWMTRAQLLGRIFVASARRGVEYRYVRGTYRHEIWKCGGMSFAVPRRRELTEGVTRSILQRLESVLGDAWWT
jgi:hypothetical protein